MYGDVLMFSTANAIDETASAVRTICRSRGRTRILVPDRERSPVAERRLMAAAAGAGIHVSLDAVDPVAAKDRFMSDTDTGAQAAVVVRRGEAPLTLGVLERALLRRRGGPVWFWNQAKSAKLTVVAACALDPTDPARGTLDATTVDLGMTIAAKTGGRLILAHASSTAAPSAELEALANRCTAAGVDCVAEVKAGTAISAIPEIMRDHGASVLVAGTMHRTGLAALRRPNTVDRLAEGARYSLAVVSNESPGLAPTRKLDNRRSGAVALH